MNSSPGGPEGVLHIEVEDVADTVEHEGVADPRLSLLLRPAANRSLPIGEQLRPAASPAPPGRLGEPVHGPHRVQHHLHLDLIDTGEPPTSSATASDRRPTGTIRW